MATDHDCNNEHPNSLYELLNIMTFEKCRSKDKLEIKNIIT